MLVRIFSIASSNASISVPQMFHHVREFRHDDAPGCQFTRLLAAREADDRFPPYGPCGGAREDACRSDVGIAELHEQRPEAGKLLLEQGADALYRDIIRSQAGSARGDHRLHVLQRNQSRHRLGNLPLIVFHHLVRENTVTGFFQYAFQAEPARVRLDGSCRGAAQQGDAHASRGRFLVFDVAHGVSFRFSMTLRLEMAVSGYCPSLSFSSGLHMSHTLRSATAGPVRGPISTPVFPLASTVHLTVSVRSSSRKVTLQDSMGIGWQWASMCGVSLTACNAATRAASRASPFCRERSFMARSEGPLSAMPPSATAVLLRSALSPIGIIRAPPPCRAGRARRDIPRSREGGCPACAGRVSTPPERRCASCRSLRRNPPVRPPPLP